MFHRTAAEVYTSSASFGVYARVTQITNSNIDRNKRARGVTKYLTARMNQMEFQSD